MSASFLLAGLQLYAAISSLSLSFFSTLINTIFDPISNVFLDWVYKKSQKLSKNRWPDGGSRLTTIANCCFSFLMIMVNFALIVESIRSLIEGEESTEASNTSGEINGIHVPSIAAVGVAFLVKIGLCVYCGLCKHLSTQIEILYIDHRNDLPVNGFGILTSAGGTVLRWWIDPAGSIIISIGVIIVWLVTLVKQFKNLAGESAPERVRKKVLYKALHFSDDIMHIDQCYVYHCGQDLNVRIAITMHRDTPLYNAQLTALHLQNDLSDMENVHAVYVDVFADDVELPLNATSHSHSHSHSHSPTHIVLPESAPGPNALQGNDFTPSDLSTIAESGAEHGSSGSASDSTVFYSRKAHNADARSANSALSSHSDSTHSTHSAIRISAELV